MEDLVMNETKIESSTPSILVSRQQDEGGEIPKWLVSVLTKTFFGICSTHSELHQGSELNGYCIDCDLAYCKHCVFSPEYLHHRHRVLKIYRHVYKDVVPLDEIKLHLDISGIQTYKCNKKWIISFNPLPHNGSGSQCTDQKDACFVCKRKLHDPQLYRFCCIGCKVEAVSKKLCGNDKIKMKLENTGSFRKHKRKQRTPSRAPLF